MTLKKKLEVEIMDLPIMSEAIDEFDKALKLYKQETLEEAAEEYVKNFAMSVKSAREIGFIDGAKWQQERICDSEVIQRIRASKSDAEARRIIRTV